MAYRRCAVVAACVLAAFDPQARRALGVVVGISVIGFLFLYFQAGAPSGPLQKIAIVDAAVLFRWRLSSWLHGGPRQLRKGRKAGKGRSHGQSARRANERGSIGAS